MLQAFLEDGLFLHFVASLVCCCEETINNDYLSLIYHIN